jgi:glycosyltransferase involved in cell wall biosynthesis
VKVDILYCAWNRLEFTTHTWQWLMAHTNWDLVERVVVYDDGSEDGTKEFLLQHDGTNIRHHARSIPIEVRHSNLQSPAAIMNHYIATAQADAFVKVDNDIALCGSWLDVLYYTFVENPDVELLGMEAGMVAMQGRDGVFYSEYGVEYCSHIGGVGMMRVSSFKERPPIPSRIGFRIGFTEWQDRYDPVRGWIIPDLNVPQLDRLPFEPWVSLTEEYVAKGWNRQWPKYSEQWMSAYWDWMNA